jgi:hypothetical protein
MTSALLRAVYNVVFRKQFRGYRTLGWALIASCPVGTALAVALVGPEGLFFLVFALPALIMGVGVLFLPAATHRQLRSKLLPAGAEMWHYTVTPEAITERTPQYTTVWPWATVTTLVEAREHWIVVMRPGSAVPLPKAGFDPAAAAAVAGLLAPYVSAGRVPRA